MSDRTYRAFYSEPERPALHECIDAADLAGIRAVRAKLGATAAKGGES